MRENNNNDIENNSRRNPQTDIIKKLNGLRTDSQAIREEIARLNATQTKASKKQQKTKNEKSKGRNDSTDDKQERRRRTKRELESSRRGKTDTRLSQQLLSSNIRTLDELRTSNRQDQQRTRNDNRRYRRTRDTERRNDRRNDRNRRRDREDERDRHEDERTWFSDLKEGLLDVANAFNINSIRDSVSGDINSAGDTLRDLNNSMGNNADATKALHTSFNKSIKLSGAGTSRQDYAEIYSALYDDLGVKQLKDIEALAPAFDVLTNSLGVSADATEELTKNFKDPKILKGIIGNLNRSSNYNTDMDALTEMASTFSALNKNLDPNKLEGINKNIVGVFAGLQNQGIDTNQLQDMFLDASRMSQSEYMQSHGGMAGQYYNSFKSGNTDALLNYVQQVKNSPLQMAETLGISQEDMTMIKNANLDEIMKVSKDVAGGTYDEALQRQEDMQVGVFDRFGNWLSKTWIGGVIDNIQANTNIGMGDIFTGITALGTISNWADKFGWGDKIKGTRLGGKMARGLGRAKGGAKGAGKAGAKLLGKGARGAGRGAMNLGRGAVSRLGSLGVGSSLSGIGSSITGSIATLGGGSLAVGGAGILGGLGGLAGIASAGKNFYKAFKSDDKEEKRKETVKGGTKLGMVGAGAGIGAGIGSVVPVVGTAVGGLIGAGVGGISAILSGDKVGEWVDGLGGKIKEGISNFTKGDWIGLAFKTMGSLALNGFMGAFGVVGNLVGKIFGSKKKSSLDTKASEKTAKRKKSKSSFDIFNPSTWFNGSHRDGLDRVPFDGYRAILHKDETVLTKKEADQYRVDKNAGQSSKLSSKLMGMSKEASATYKDFYDKLKATNAGSGSGSGSGDSASSDGGDLNLAPGSKTTAKQAFPVKDNDKFINTIGKLAQRTARQSGILPSTTIAQAIEESGWGMSRLTQQANALFGIKAGSSWGGKVWTGKTLEYNSGGGSYGIKAGFRAYDSIEESIIDHDKLLNKPTYTRYDVPRIKDPLKQVQAIKQSGYATNPSYVNDVYRHVKSHNLDKFNKYEQGTPFVPDTQVALLHKGEMVVPAKNNPNNMTTTKVSTDKSDDLLEVVKVLQQGFEAVIQAIREGKEIKALPRKAVNSLNRRYNEMMG